MRVAEANELTRGDHVILGGKHGFQWLGPARFIERCYTFMTDPPARRYYCVLDNGLTRFVSAWEMRRTA